jgi:diguanylate cyclase (GGDEF)-like protein
MVFAPGWSPDRALFALIDALDEGALIFDEHSLCRLAGRRAAELLGTDPRELVGISRQELLHRVKAASGTPEAVRLLEDDALPNESTVADPIEILRPLVRTVVWTSIPVVKGLTRMGRIDILRDVTRERRAEEAHEAASRRLIQLSPIDELTGLVNRRRFQEECEREHRRAQRTWASYAIVRVDVDGMTRINEGYGRELGDELLRRVGEELRVTRREYDMVARWDADEFIMLLPGADGRAAKQVLKRTLVEVHAKGSELVPGMSVCAGSAIWTPPSGETAADIIERAGHALDVARVLGFGKVEVDVGAGEWKDEMTEDGD